MGNEEKSFQKKLWHFSVPVLQNALAALLVILIFNEQIREWKNSWFPAKNATFFVKGEVKSLETSSGISGVTVYKEGNIEWRAVTDSSGVFSFFFEIPDSSTTTTIVAMHPQFGRRELQTTRSVTNPDEMNPVNFIYD